MTEDDWLDACADEPDDDLRRYAFADWLEEKGDIERAEFIRLQVALSHQKECDRDLWKRTRELLWRNEQAWLGPLLLVAAADHWHFYRGVPTRLQVNRVNRSFFLSEDTSAATSGDYQSPHMRWPTGRHSWPPFFGRE